MSQSSYHLAKIEITLITELICIDMTEIELIKFGPKQQIFVVVFTLSNMIIIYFFIFIKNMIKDNIYFSEK
jgi:hypothetical protein